LAFVFGGVLLGCSSESTHGAPLGSGSGAGGTDGAGGDAGVGGSGVTGAGGVGGTTTASGGVGGEGGCPMPSTTCPSVLAAFAACGGNPAGAWKIKAM